MRISRIIALGCLAGALTGCAQVASDLNTLNAALASPNATQAATNLKNWTVAVTCAIANTAQLATEIEAAINAGTAVQTTTGKIYTVSATVCKALGGTAGATVAVSAVQ
jgi:hypothetical protein